MSRQYGESVIVSRNDHGKTEAFALATLSHHLLVTLICLVAVSWYATTSLREFYLNQSTKDLEARARLLEYQFLERLDPLDERGIELLSKKIGGSASTRVAVITHEQLSITVQSFIQKPWGMGVSTLPILKLNKEER